jgi:hypothetical protein
LIIIDQITHIFIKKLVIGALNIQFMIIEGIFLCIGERELELLEEWVGKGWVWMILDV